MSVARSAIKVGWSGSRRVVRTATASDSQRLKRKLRADPYWNQPLDGRAPRLDPRTSIEVTRVGRFSEIDPHATAEGYRSGWKAVGLLAWAGVVGAAWWVGSSRGRGPLKVLAEEHEWSF